MHTDKKSEAHGCRKRGAALVLMVSLLILCSLVALVAVSLLAQGTTSGLGLGESAQAYAIAVGGKEWYLQQLKADSDWTNEANQTNITLGGGTFDITVSSPSTSSISFTVTGKVPGYLNQTVQRQVSLAARKLPKACRFALFWQEDGPGAALSFLESGWDVTQITGNFWSRGSTDIPSRSLVQDGWIYYAQGESVTGLGSYASCEVQQPFPEMPILDTSYYDNLMNQYDTDIDNNPSTPADSITLSNTNVTLTGQTYNCYDLITYNNVTISGHGKVVVKNDVLLHNVGGLRAQNLTITPSGGTIEILAGNHFKINNTTGRRRVNINPGTIMYARNQDDTDRLFQVFQRSSVYYTSITEALLMAGRRLIVEDGATITDSTLYVDYADSDTNNLFQITEDSTVSGKVISEGRAFPSLQINDGASVSGLVYQYGSATRGRLEIDGDSTVNGVVLCRQFQNDSLGPATINYDLSAVLDAMSQGWDGYVMTEPNSWDDH